MEAAERELRDLWTAKGVSEERQNELIADVTVKAQPGAKVGLFTIGDPMVTCPQCEGTPDLCNGYCEGNGMVTTNHAAEWRRQNREPQAGKTLADFANSGKLFKRPMHANPHGFTAGSDHLREIRTSNWQGQHNVIADFPRLTREDLTATDWQEVTGEV